MNTNIFSPYKLTKFWTNSEKSDLAFFVAMSTLILGALLYFYIKLKSAFLALYKMVRKPKKNLPAKFSTLDRKIPHQETMTITPRHPKTISGLPPIMMLPPPEIPNKNKRHEGAEKNISKNSKRTADIVSKLFEGNVKKEEKRHALKLRNEIARMDRPVPDWLFRDEEDEVKEKSKSLIITPTNETPELNPRISQAIYILDKSATYLLNFKFEEKANNNLKKMLAFLFNFHRYNMVSGVLTKGNAEIVLRCLSLRTSIVHSAQQAHLDEATVLTTQAMMKAFLFQEAVTLVQPHIIEPMIPAHYLPKLFTLAGNTLSTSTFYCIQKTPLYKAFDYQQENLDDIISEHIFIADEIFYRWMKYEVIPCMNALKLELKSQALRAEALDALRMMLIIIGEYCNKARAIRIEDVAKTYSGNIHSEPQLMKELILACREARNHLAHRLNNLNNQVINDILEFACNINADLAPLTGVAGILSPPAIESVITSAPRP